MSTVEPKATERSLGDLFGEMSSNMSELIRKEMELARVELKEEAVQAGKAGGKLGAGAFVAYLAVVMLSFALAWGLNDVFNNSGWLGFVVVGGMYAIAGAFLVSEGRAQLKSVRPVPQQTVQTLKEDLQWAKEQKS